MKNPANQPVKRRTPRQERALGKIELMFEATIRILENEGLDSLTTNRIAAVAGISIGTLYQYFPDKDALISQLVQREITKTFELLSADLSPQPDPAFEPGRVEPFSPRVRHAVRVLLTAFDGRLRARRLLLLALARGGQSQMLDEQLQELGLRLLTGDAGGPGLSRIQAFVLARAISGALRSALIQDESLLKSPEFEDSLCRLVQGFLTFELPAGVLTRQAA